jgi:polyhydroxyalkanoate synthesis regulator phasin
MGRKNTITRFLEDIVDDTKDFVDDLIDRAKDVEKHGRDAVTDAVGDDESGDVGRRDAKALRASLDDLKAKVDELASQSSGSRAGTRS